METRLNACRSGRGAMPALAGLVQRIAQSDMQRARLAQLRLRASQLNRNADCQRVAETYARSVVTWRLP